MAPALLRLLYLSIVLLTAAGPVRADDAAVIGKWYGALLTADRAVLSELLAENARIRLDDLGIEQSKDEFIASMDEWEGAVAGAAIRHRIDSQAAGVTTVTACYDFPANDIMMQETFTIEGDHVAASTQATVAENCDSF
ncbi:hypothetical protein ASD44_14895 [Mesorhizobium sp. Root554]|nr:MULTISPECIES: hypothetical protein [unclassified Mesorhizobium]KQZ15197.1 hypothetical protein ASD27_14900 [Mesorhizobium sp. Root1471]KQZ37705.1 hypothetical protein ASD44_14895 [Mesorhizobium sp. Root554]